MNEIIYKCPDCAWEGMEDEMKADYSFNEEGGDEAWSSWICPKCGTWYQLEDYQKIKKE